MKTAFEDEGAKGIILLINSPGGSPVQAGIINDEIKRLRRNTTKPLYAVVEETCASGAYYIAAATDKIFVDKASIVGTIGVLMDGFGFTGLMDKLGVERRLLTAGENKGFLDPFSPLSRRAARARPGRCSTRSTSSSSTWSRTAAASGSRKRRSCSAACSGPASRPSNWAWPISFGNVDYVAREVIKAEDVDRLHAAENVAERLAKKFGAAIGDGAVKALGSLQQLR